MPDTPKYTVISKTDNAAVLRVADPRLYAAYSNEYMPNASAPMYVHVSQTPPNVTLVDQYEAFSPDMPIVSLEINGASFDITDKVSANFPNTEVPGLYRVDYIVNVPGHNDAPIYSAYVSVQQRPILRKAAAGWTRDGYIVRTLNRLILEPQFMEALHAAGEPLYGFMEANQHPAIKAANLANYSGIQAWGVDNQPGCIFITGERLPQGTVAVFRRRMLQLEEPVWPDPVGVSSGMDGSHERIKSNYEVGSVVRSGNVSYICIREGSDSLSDTSYWLPGYLYRHTAVDGEQVSLPIGPIPPGNGGIEHIWAAVDNQGYSFWVDIYNRTSLGVYRGHYDKRHFADYGPGDIVSYVTADSIRLYKRKPTDIQDPATLIYSPGHHLNPAWEELYCQFPDDMSPLLGDGTVIPHPNAANAIISKTWSVSSEMCQAYANMVGIPDAIVKECGAKWSALLFALLSRTRNTYEGLRTCFRAVGLDITNLRMTDPALECKVDGDTVEDIYGQHEALRRLTAYMDTLMPMGKEVAADGNLRYFTDADGTTSIQQYDGATRQWATRYTMICNMPSQAYNSRRYEGELNVLARLASDAVKNLGDGHSWVKESAWAGGPSRLVAECLRYEIPIYIYFMLRMWLYSEGHIDMQGFVYTGMSDAQRCGARNVIMLYPSKYYSLSAHDYVVAETGVYVQEDDEWVEVSPTKVTDDGVRIYEFDHVVHPLRIRAVNPDEAIFVRYWRSTHTFGILGIPGATMDELVDVADATDTDSLMLANGLVGVTALYRPRQATVTAYAYRWQYVLGEESGWAIDESTPFADWEPAITDVVLPYDGPVSGLKDRLHTVTEGVGGHVVEHGWRGDTLELYNAVGPTYHLLDVNGAPLCVVSVDNAVATALLPEDIVEYGASNIRTVRLEFANG